MERVVKRKVFERQMTRRDDVSLFQASSVTGSQANSLDGES